MGPIDFNVTIICLKLSMCLIAPVNNSRLTLVLTCLADPVPGRAMLHQPRGKRIKGTAFVSNLKSDDLKFLVFILEVDAVS